MIAVNAPVVFYLLLLITFLLRYMYVDGSQFWVVATIMLGGASLYHTILSDLR